MRRRFSGIKKTDIRNVVAFILAFAGLCFLLYPAVDNKLYEIKVSAEKEAFLKRVHATTYNYEGFSGDDGNYSGGGDGGGFIYNEDGDRLSPAPNPFDELYQFLAAENVRLYESGQDDLKDAFSYETAGIDLSGFGLEDGCIGYLEIPSIKALMPIYLGANTQNMKKGAAHMTQTSYPIGGNNTNAVIAAHRGGTCEMLRNIHRIQLGDEIIVTNFRERLVYRAAEIKIILPTEIDEVKIREDQDLITLISCNPLGKNTQRYALFCTRDK